MTLTVVRIARRWYYESDAPAGTPTSVSHVIHVPDQIEPLSVNGAQCYKLQPHPMNLLNQPLTAEQLLSIAHSHLSSRIYVVTTII